MNSQKLTRTSYTDPSEAGNPTRPNAVQDSEALVDFTDYDKPLEEIHGSNLHGWGIAAGLTVTATLNAPGLQVLPGVAIDSAGQHISLAVGGYAQTGNTPTPPPDQSTLLPPPATSPGGMGAGGVNVPTTGLAGSMYLTIRFYETFDNNLKISSGFNSYQMDHTPWLQLVTTAPADGSSLVLAQVTLDSKGNVTSLAPGPRQGPSLPLQRLSVCNYVSSDVTSIGASLPEIGALLPRATGGLTIQADTLGIQSIAGNENVFIDVAGGNVGIGTKTPKHTLEVNGTINATDVLKGGNPLSESQWQTGTGGVISYQGGNVGIGTKTPKHTLEVNGTINATDVLKGGNPLGESQWQTGTGGVISYQGGNVGIGTTTPKHTLEVNGTINATDVLKGGNSLVSSQWQPGTSGVISYQGGNVGIGTTTPGHTLDVTGQINATEGFLIDGTPLVSSQWQGDGGAITYQGAVNIMGNTLHVSCPTAIGLFVYSQDTPALVAESVVNGNTVTQVALGSPQYAGAFTGDVRVTGTLSKTAGTFKIDHLLDPANKYLVHSVVESPDMMNVYNGNVITDDRGEVVVTLPDYFEALNANYRYQLTVIGQPALAYVSEEIAESRFSIKTDRPGVKVSWQITGIRRDPYALANPVVVEEDKSEAERGLYLHPALYGQPEDLGINKVNQARRQPAQASAAQKYVNGI